LAVKIRLTRIGRKKKPYYRIVAIDSRSPRDGRYLENLGVYNPLPDPFEIKLKEDRVLYWLGVGAVPTDTVKSLLRKEGVLFKWDLVRRGLSPEQMEQEMKRWEVIQLERKRKLELKLTEQKLEKEKVEAKLAEGAGEEVAAEVEQAQEAKTDELTSEQATSEPEKSES